MSNKRRRASVLVALVALLLIPLFGMSTAAADPQPSGATGASSVASPAKAGAERVIARTTLQVPKAGKNRNGEAPLDQRDVIFCFVELYEPFFGPQLQILTHINVFCEQFIPYIYAEVIIFWNGEPHLASFNSKSAFSAVVLNVTSLGTPCNSGSGNFYSAFGYVEVVGYDGIPDNGEVVSESSLVC
jgi:hypothetical protein